MRSPKEGIDAPLSAYASTKEGQCLWQIASTTPYNSLGLLLCKPHSPPVCLEVLVSTALRLSNISGVRGETYNHDVFLTISARSSQHMQVHSNHLAQDWVDTRLSKL